MECRKKLALIKDNILVVVKEKRDKTFFVQNVIRIHLLEIGISLEARQNDNPALRIINV